MLKLEPLEARLLLSAVHNLDTDSFQLAINANDYPINEVAVAHTFDLAQAGSATTTQFGIGLIEIHGSVSGSFDIVASVLADIVFAELDDDDERANGTKVTSSVSLTITGSGSFSLMVRAASVAWRYDDYQCCGTYASSTEYRTQVLADNLAIEATGPAISFSLSVTATYQGLTFRSALVSADYANQASFESELVLAASSYQVTGLIQGDSMEIYQNDDESTALTARDLQASQAINLNHSGTDQLNVILGGGRSRLLGYTGDAFARDNRQFVSTIYVAGPADPALLSTYVVIAADFSDDVGVDYLPPRHSIRHTSAGYSQFYAVADDIIWPEVDRINAQLYS